MTESFTEYAIAHEAGHAVVGKFVKICSPREISFALRRDSEGKLFLGDFDSGGRLRATFALRLRAIQLVALPLLVIVATLYDSPAVAQSARLLGT
jgi:hypothetical protein